ncbi:MAG: hypothetical protein JXR86_15665, partial [Spirochaetales bacterium]|nr:hypothetical protein [Spirochaetales bacterium]
PETWTIARLETPPLIALHAFRDLLAETRGRAIRLGVNREQRIIFWAYGNAGVPGQLYSKIIRELGGCHERTVAPQQHRDRLINTWMRALADQKLRVVFYSLTEKSGITYLRYRLFDEENLIESPIRNREVLCDRLVRGLEINIIRHGNREVSLLLNSRDLLPAEMVPYFRNIRTACRTSFGVLLQDYEIAHINKGLYCALFYRVDGYLTFCIGEFETSGARGICRDPLRMWKVPFGRMESLLNNLAEEWDYKNYTWEHETLNLKETVSYLKRRQLNRNFRDKIEKYPYYNCFLSENWTPDYYRQQARLGFIAATESLAFSRWLMPELEWFYSVLDWNDLVIDKKVRKILRNRREEPLILRIDRDPRVVLENLEKVWKRTWISREYRELIQKLSTDEERLKDEGFAIWGITLLAGERRIPVAGDLGYTIGTTYTSLSGFFHRNMKQYSSYGKLQLIMQAKILERCGLAFWNLGQPYMKYKSDLGAHHEQRTTYLKRWDRAAAGPSPDLSGEFVLHKDLQINWEKHLSRSPYSGEAREDLYEDLIADFTFSV